MVDLFTQYLFNLLLLYLPIQLRQERYKLCFPDSLAAKEYSEVRKGRYKLSILLVYINRSRVVLE